MNSEEIRKRMDEIYAEKKVLDEERKALQESCPHEEYTVMDWYWRIAASYPARVCDHCDANIGKPTEEETKAHVESQKLLNEVRITTYNPDNEDNRK
jgi:hypothetical protein